MTVTSSRAVLPPRFLAALTLVLGDLLILEATVWLGVLARRLALPWFPIEMPPSIYTGTAVAVLFLPLAYGMAGLYPGYGITGVERLRKRILVTCLCFGALILFDHLAQAGKWSRGILLAAGWFALVAVPLWDAAARALLLKWRCWGEAVIVLGPGDRRAGVVKTLRSNPELGWIPLHEDDLTEGGPDGGKPPGIELALVVLPAGSFAPASLADDLPYSRVVLVPEMEGTQSLWMQVRDLGTHLGLEMRRNLLMPRNRLVKRALDLILGTLLLLLTAPAVAFFAALVPVLSPGPAFFCQIRAGKDGRPFRMWKIRTMRPDADRLLEGVISASAEARAEWDESMTISNDPRIIPVLGHFMRRFSIDELPQFWNVVKGEMSLVGPRPLPAYHLERYDPQADRLRQRIHPGITGLCQVSGRTSASVAEQQRLDLYYLRNWSPWLDLHILARTVVAVARGTGS